MNNFFLIYFLNAQRVNEYKLYNNRAILYIKLKDYKKALTDINKAIKLKKDYHLAYLNRSEIYYRMGNEKKACQDYKKALKLGVREYEFFQETDILPEIKKLCD